MVRTLTLLFIILTACSSKQQESNDQLQDAIVSCEEQNTDSCCTSDIELIDSINNLFPERMLDGYIKERAVLDTMGMHILYSRYLIFDTGLKTMPYPTDIHAYEFDNRSVTFGTDKHFGKIIVNDPDEVTIIALSDKYLSSIKRKGDINIVTLLDIIEEAKRFPKARFKYDTVIEEMREENWIAHFRKRLLRGGILLENLDGYDSAIGLMNYTVFPRFIHYSDAELDTMTAKAYSKRPPFLFADWEEYAVPFYRYGYAPMP